MKQTQESLFGRWIMIVAVFLLFAGSAYTAQASYPPSTSQAPIAVRLDGPSTNPVYQDETPIPSQNAQQILLPPLKAVLIVGPIDGDYGNATTTEKNNMELAAKELEARGVTVYRFYAPDTNWDQIKAVANGAHFLMYRGHGVAWGALPNPPVGGFALNGRFVSNDDIRNDIRLAPNAIVMLYGCFTAGSSSSDTASIGIDEAKRRVEMYSDPFFDAGAGGYYADWFGDAFQLYVRYLFSGMTQKQAYEAYHDYSSDRIFQGAHADHSYMPLWMGWDEWYDPKPQYNNAFAGRLDWRLDHLFSAP